MDLDSLYAAADEPEAEGDPLDALGSAFGGAPAASGSRQSRPRTRTKKKSGLPMPLLLAGGGGAVALLAIVVVLVIVLSGGGEDDEDGNSDGLAVVTKRTTSGDTSATASTGGGFSLSPSGSGRSADPEDEVEPLDEPEDEDEVDDGPDIRMVSFPGNDDPLTDWTLSVDRSVAEAARQVQRAGLVFTAPTTWQSESNPSDDGTPQIRDTVVTSPDNSITVQVMTGRFGSPSPPMWPTLMTATAKPGDKSEEELLFGTSTPWRGPNEFVLVPEYTAEELEFGTMLGGYRFVRFVTQGTRSDNTQVKAVHYIGTAGDLYFHITVLGENADAAKLAEAEWIARSARLMTDSGLEAFGKKHALFQDWLKDSGVKIARASDAPPVKEAEPGVWGGFIEDSDFEAMMAMAGAAGPRRSPYRVAPPAGLELAAVSRLAVRWQPNENGLWLAMEQRDLGSRWRRTDTPMLSADRAMIAGREMELPEGTERSEFEVNGNTVYRFLMPEQPTVDHREVYYVVLDRGVLVTVIGRYAKSRPGDLELLDAAAKTFNKS